MLKPLMWVFLAGCVKTVTVSTLPDTPAIPLRIHDSGHLFVPLELGNQTFEFIVDTGASFTVISPQTQAALGIVAVNAEGSVAAGADGQGMMLSIITLPLVNLAGQTLTDVQAAVMPMDHLADPLQQPVSGVLGQNILAQFRVELDLQADTFALSDPNSPRLPTDSWTIPFDFFAVAPIMRVFVTGPDGQRIPAVFDSGAGATILNQAAADCLGAVAVPDTEVSEATGANDTLLHLAEARLKTLQLANLQLSPSEVYIADLGIFDQLGVGDGPAIILGIDLFDERRLTLNYPSKTLWVSKTRR
ncbi:MAG: putative aspartyl protease [Myxococcota bacterium]|jgi:predicted aspartyl protease